jgi:hypothetical protein
MTYPISDITRRVVYSGSLGTGPYPFTFEILEEGDIGVYKNQTLLTLSADYTVTINADGTGEVDLVSAAASTDTVAIFGDKGIQRQTDFTTGGDLFANSLNDELDAQTIFAQQNAEAIVRAIRAPQFDPTNLDMTLPSASDRADTVLTFDTNGEPQATSSSDFVAGLSGSILGANYVTNTAVGDGSTVNFTVSVAPGAKGNIQIYIDGVYQNKSSFSISGTTITFTEAPPLNASVEFIIGYSIGSTTGDASGVDFTQQGTGAVTTTVAQKLWETISVKDFGAVGDGVTDDYAAIQAAIDAAISVGGSTVYFPAGTYYVSQVITTPTSRNDYPDYTVKLTIQGVAGGTWITRDTVAMPNYDYDIAGFTARHDSAAFALRGDSVSIRDIAFKNSTIGLYIGDNPHRTDVDFTDPLNPDIADTAANSFNHIENLKAYDCGVGVFMEASHGTYYNTFISWHLKECNVGLVTRDRPNAASKVNRNTFVNIRANRCPIGFFLEDANTNVFNGLHTENCQIGATGLNAAYNNTNLLTSWSGTAPSAISTSGCGTIVDSSKNHFFGCVPESCDYDLYITPSQTNNDFYGCAYDNTGEKVWFESLPRHYFSTNVTIQNGGMTVTRSNAATAQEITQGWPSGISSTYLQAESPKLLGATVYKDSDTCLTINRKTDYGDLIELQKDGTKFGEIGIAGGIPYIASASGIGIRPDAGGLSPTDSGGVKSDNTATCGLGAYRWSVVYAATGTINTSDENEKQQIESLSAAELAVATTLKGSIKKFKFNDAVESKGDDARIHVGVIAQDVETAFTAQGLNASDYGIFCEDTWTDDDGNEQTRKGVRYEELLAFIIGAM